MDIRSFKDYALAQIKAERRQSFRDPLPAIRENLNLLESAGVFNSVENAERRLNHFFSKLRDNRKIYDFAVSKSIVQPSKRVTHFDIVIKPTRSLEYIYLPFMA